MARKRWTPEQVGAELAGRFRTRHRSWFGAPGAERGVEADLAVNAADGQDVDDVVSGKEWPLRIPLGTPTEREVSGDPGAVRLWAQEWVACPLPGRLESGTRLWARLGEQTVPTGWILDGPEQVAQWCGQGERWARACRRRAIWVQHWRQYKGRHQEPCQEQPAGRQRGQDNEMADRPVVPARLFDVFADYDDADFERLLTTLGWLLANPASSLYLRQLPLEGVDTKWVGKRTGLIVEMLAWLRARLDDGSPERPVERGAEPELEPQREPEPELEPELEPEPKGRKPAIDFFAATGLRPPFHRIRLRILCPALRRLVGGLQDIEAPTEELARLALTPEGVIVVENRETGVALPGLDGMVAFMGLGRSVGLLRGLPWLRGRPGWYWGDIDTHGLEILARAREALPGLQSMLMDERTLLRYRHLAVQESQQHPGTGLEPLTAAERALFAGLKDGRWGARLRLEQERIPWDAVERALDGIRPAPGQDAGAG